MNIKVAAGALLTGGVLTGSAMAGGGGAEFHYSNTSYLGLGDSPLAITADDFWLHDFETDGGSFFGFDIVGGFLKGPSSSTDSVDADDGNVDGLGTQGWSWKQATAVNGILITFDAKTLGALPTQAGLVWTDGTTDGLAVFEAWDENGISLGMFGETVGDGTYFGTTNEDRFFGATYEGGISAIKITGPSLGIEIDHIQFGLLVPGPGALALFGLAGIAGRRRRRA